MGPTLLPIFDKIEIVEGCAPGADTAGYYFRKAHNLPGKRFEADWDLYGKAAGPIRNEQMAVYCAGGLGFAFWDGSSRGTADMIRRAKAHNIKMIVHEFMPHEFYFKQLMQEWIDKCKKYARP